MATFVFDKRGNLIKLADEIKSDWRVAAWKLERRAQKRWGQTDLALSALEEELPVNISLEVSKEQKASVFRAVREKLRIFDELGEQD